MKKDLSKNKSIWSRFQFQKNLLTGLITVLPVILSFYVFVFIVNFTVGIFRIDQIAGIIMKTLPIESVDEQRVRISLTVLVIIVILVLIYLIGLLARYLFIRKVLGLAESVLYRIPIFNKIYITLKQISGAFWGNKATIFKRVVLVEYPRKGLFTLGFLTLKAQGQIQEITNESVSNVFIPTTPNPTSGYLIMVPEKDITYLSMSVEDGMKLVISGGAVTPARPSLDSEDQNVLNTSKE